MRIKITRAMKVIQAKIKMLTATSISILSLSITSKNLIIISSNILNTITLIILLTL
jgi:hypothetical protein